MTTVYFFAIVVVCVAIYLIFFSDSAVIKGIIGKTARKKIGEVKDDESVSVSGKIVFAGRVMTAPLSKRPCVLYHAKVVDNNSNRDLIKNYINIDERKISDVVIFDGQNYAYVDPRLIASHIVEDAEYYSGFWDTTTPELKDFLKKHGERTSNIMGWSLSLHATEGVLEEGEEIVVAGKARWRKSVDLRLKLPSEKVLWIGPLNEHGVYLTDDTF